MRQYQFKTLNVSSNNVGLADIHKSVQHQAQTANHAHNRQNFISNSFKVQLPGPAPVQSDLNINDMKKRLDMLLKQTENLTDRGNHTSLNKTVQDKKAQQKTNNLSFSISGSPERNYGYHKEALEKSTNISSSQSIQNLKGSGSFSIDQTSLKPAHNVQNLIENKNLSEAKTIETLKDNDIFKHQHKPSSEQPNIKAKLQRTNNIMNVQNRQSSSITPNLITQQGEQKKINRDLSQSRQKTEMRQYTEINQRRPSTHNEFSSFPSLLPSSGLTGSRARLDEMQGLKKQQLKPIEIPNNIYDCQSKLRMVDIQNRKLKQDLKQLAEGKEYYRKQLSQQWRNNKKIKDEYEQKIIEIKSTHAQEIKKLQEIIQKKQINIVELVREVAEAKVTVTLESYDEKAKKVLESNQKLIQELSEKSSTITELKSQIVTKNEQIQSLTQKLQMINDEMTSLNNLKNQRMHSQMENFDQILKVQLKSIADFKQVIERLNEKNNQLRQKLIQSGRKNESLANENRISDLKHKSSINSLVMESAIEVSNKQNALSTLNKKLLTLEEKHKSALNQIKAKDQFLKQHLIGRTDSIDVRQYIESVLEKYRNNFAESKQDQLKADLAKALKKIELYQKYG